MSDIIAKTTNDFSHDYFELLNFIIAKKLMKKEGGIDWWPFCSFRLSLLSGLILLQKLIMIFLTII